MKPILCKAVIFDMDGTLVDSLLFWRHLERYILQSLGLPLIDMPEEELPGSLYQRTADFVNMRLMAQEANAYADGHIDPSFRPEFPIERYTAEDIRQYAKQLAPRFYDEEAQVKPHVPEFLSMLRQQKVPLAIATATCTDAALFALNRLGLIPYMDAIYTCDLVGRGKSHPDIYLRAAETLGTLPQETVVFEDNENCVRTTVTAGFPTVAVADSRVSLSRQEQAIAAAPLAIHSFEEAIAFFESGTIRIAR